MIDIDPTAQQMLGEHARGDSYRKIGKRHRVSHKHAKQVVIRQARQFLDGIELSLMVASKLERLGRHREAEWPGLAVPHQPGDGWQLSVSLLQFVVTGLRERGLDVHVQTRPVPDGIVYLLTLGEESP